MTLEEAKEVLLKLEQLVAKTNRMYKKGERMDSPPFLKLHRKRIALFDLQNEAEGIVREGDLEFYRAWVERVVDKPTSWGFLHFRQKAEEMSEILRKAIRLKGEGEIYSFFIDTADTMKVAHRELESPDWREAVTHSPYFTREQIDALLQKSDLLLTFYRLYDEWTETLRSISPEVVDVDKYVQNAYRILWVLPADLPGQRASLPSLLRKYPTWEEFPCKLYAYSKMIFVSFVIQQLYYYRFDKETLLSYDYICRHASAVDWYDSLKRTAIVNLNRTTPEELRDLVCRLQPNVILTPGTLSSVLSALGWSLGNEQLRSLTGETLTLGIATLHRLNSITFVQTPLLTDGAFSVEEYTTDICQLMRQVYAGSYIPLSATTEINTEIDPGTYLYDEVKKAIARRCYVDADYPDAVSGTYRKVHFLPCLLKKHAGDWYVIGKRTDGIWHPYYLDSLHYLTATDEREEVPDSQLLPYRYAYGVHLRTDLRSNPDLSADGAELFLVRLRVQAPLWQELLLHPLHFSQDLLPASAADKPGSRTLQYRMYITDELIRLLRSYGSRLEVLSPDVLRREVTE